jgi:hypothetical protein
VAREVVLSAAIVLVKRTDHAWGWTSTAISAVLDFECCEHALVSTSAQRRSVLSLQPSSAATRQREQPCFNECCVYTTARQS